MFGALDTLRERRALRRLGRSETGSWSAFRAILARAERLAGSRGPSRRSPHHGPLRALQEAAGLHETLGA
jgi:hypothetical protein